MNPEIVQASEVVQAGAPGQPPQAPQSGQPAQYAEPMPVSTNPHTYVIQPRDVRRDDWLRWSNWIPSTQQMAAAARLHLKDAIDPYERGLISVTMRQGIGMIAVLGLIAGFIPFLADLWLGLRLQTAVPLAQVANSADQLVQAYPANTVLGVIGHTVQTIAALDPRMPGGLAGLLSALGAWINWPLSWLANWIVYGIFVFAVARLMGATNNLQSFFAATSFAAVPLLLTGLLPIPCLGPLAAAAGLILAFVVYFNAVHVATRLDIGRALVCMLLPLAVAFVLPMLMLGGALLLSRF